MDLRWQQRLQHFQKAYLELESACQKKTYNKLERGGLIQAFEFTFELAWKTLQDLLIERGYEIRGPKPTIEQAFQDGLIEDGEAWVKMLLSRNLTTHTYNEDTAEKIAESIKNTYQPLFASLIKKLN